MSKVTLRLPFDPEGLNDSCSGARLSDVDGLGTGPDCSVVLETALVALAVSFAFTRGDLIFKRG